MTTPPGWTTEACRYARKRAYTTKRKARLGAMAIQAGVEASGREYQPLYPYRCPDGWHWHLSHFKQAKARCPQCHGEVPAWRGDHWVISTHEVDGAVCSGVGHRAEEPDHAPASS